ncbi:unnamed protein product [Rotaria socialis]|uniref:Renin receptor-like C-terminal transmembrane spanning segment domain-containing protein n=1 Tax=Rotaria socialis TaxID=392032 RepID=A0A821FK08_9BILA|nr:unnamed protein product [Rotaria socialis]
MHFFLTFILISSLIYSIEAGQCQVHNQPNYLSLASTKDNENVNRITISNFANNLATLLGLSPDQTDQQEQPFFYSSRPLEIPSSTWLFHVEGFDNLFNNGTALEDNSKSDMDNLEQTLKTQISQMNDQASIKYIVIVCEDCKDDKSSEQLQNQLKTTIDQIIAKNPQTLAMTLATKEIARVRRARQTTQVSKNVTIATMYSDEYPVMFNLFFWTSLVLALIVISIAYVFLTLDPGADTIIYRMTTPRLKAD